MAIQILGLREWYNPKKKKIQLVEKFFENKWRSPSVPDLFKNIDKYLESVPEKEKYNLYYTAADCMEQKGRHLIKQDVIPFDVDGIDVEKTEEYIPVILEALGVEYDKTGIVFSGNGLQFIIGVLSPIRDEEYFDEARIHYKAMCGAINQALYAKGLNGTADTSVWSHARLLRLPNTKNVKKNKGEKQAKLIQPIIEPIDFRLETRSGIPILEAGEFVSERMLEQMPPADPIGVQDGCDFLKYCKKEQEKISEPQWYAMLSIIGRLSNGRELAHDYSREHPQYSEYETDLKLEQAIRTAGPRTCENISNLWNGCGTCPNNGQCISPISITSVEYIKTKDTGFHTIIRDINGIEKKRIPNYDDLMKWFEQQQAFITMADGNVTMVYDNNHWIDFPPRKIDSFAEDWFQPKPNNNMCAEFRGKLNRNNVKELRWFEMGSKINFQNGVLDMDNYELTDHSIDYGFRYCLPFEYDPNAEAPIFEKYLDDVTIKDNNLKAVLLEFMGYALSGMDPSLGQKALILTGEGSNGKSVFLDLLKYMAGEGNYSTLSMGYEINKLENRYQLDGKLFNISEETPAKAMLENSIFKSLVTGGEVQARKLYCDAYSMRSKAKIIMACNDIPPTNDLSHGMFRRLLIIPFRAKFEGQNEDIHMRSKLYKEASGIFNLALKALMRFRRQEIFTQSAIIDAEVKKYKMDNSGILPWWEENVEKCNADDFVPLQVMYSSYRLDMEDWGVKPLDIRQFGKEVRRITNEDVMTRRRVNAKLLTGLLGYKVIQEQENF